MCSMPLNIRSYTQLYRVNFYTHDHAEINNTKDACESALVTGKTKTSSSINQERMGLGNTEEVCFTARETGTLCSCGTSCLKSKLKTVKTRRRKRKSAVISNVFFT